jgi:hypothetical protein
MLARKYLVVSTIGALVAFSPTAQATLLAPGSGVSITDVDTTTANLLRDTVESSQGEFRGKFEEKPHEDNTSGVAFYYRIRNELLSPDSIGMFNPSGFTGRTAKDPERHNLRRGHFGSGQGIAPGAFSYIFVLKTNPTAVQPGPNSIDGRVAYDTPGPAPATPVSNPYSGVYHPLAIASHPARFVVPELGSIVLFGTMLSGLAIFVRRKFHP